MVLGAGCAKCEALFDRAREVLTEMGQEAELLKVTDLQQMIAYGVFMTPALVIDGEIISTGGLPSAKKLKKWFAKAAKS